MNTAETGEIFTEQSAELDKLAEALAKAQGAISGARKDSTNPHFKNRYADLASIWDACRDPLSKNGLSIVQTPQMSGDKGVTIVTRLLHSSGQWISGSLFVPVQQATAQGLGSAITYGRRYALASMVGVAPDDDDDANSTSQSHRQQDARPAPRAPQSAPVAQSMATDAEVQALFDLIDKAVTLAELKTAGAATEAAHKTGRLTDVDRQRLSSVYVDRKKAIEKNGTQVAPIAERAP